MTGQAIRSASSFTAGPVRDVCTPWPTNRIGLFASRISLAALAISGAPAPG